MILDPWRTHPLRMAIYNTVKPGDVVCDIGSGLGLLTFFALSAGAKHVYAIDCDTESLEVAIYYSKKHGVSDRISFIEGHSFNTVLPKKADVVICETIGSAAFDENILASLADAKKRMLKRGGKIIPSKIELYGAPAAFIGAKDTAKIETAIVSPKDLLCKPVRLMCVRTNTGFKTGIHVRHTFSKISAGRLSCIALWPRIEWTKGFITNASPTLPPTHWKQCILPLKAKQIEAGERIGFELIIRPDTSNTYEKTEILWRLCK